MNQGNYKWGRRLAAFLRMIVLGCAVLLGAG